MQLSVIPVPFVIPKQPIVISSAARNLIRADG